MQTRAGISFQDIITVPYLNTFRPTQSTALLDPGSELLPASSSCDLPGPSIRFSHVSRLPRPIQFGGVWPGVVKERRESPLAPKASELRHFEAIIRRDANPAFIHKMRPVPSSCLWTSFSPVFHAMEVQRQKVNVSISVLSRTPNSKMNPNVPFPAQSIPSPALYSPYTVCLQTGKKINTKTQRLANTAPPNILCPTIRCCTSLSPPSFTRNFLSKTISLPSILTTAAR